MSETNCTNCCYRGEQIFQLGLVTFQSVQCIASTCAEMHESTFPHFFFNLLQFHCDSDCDTFGSLGYLHIYTSTDGIFFLNIIIITIPKSSDVFKGHERFLLKSEVAYHILSQR